MLLVENNIYPSISFGGTMLRRTKALLLFSLVLVSLLAFSKPGFAQEDDPVVYALLFFSPTCPHCETVINEVLPPLVNQYGSQLVIHGINTADPQGSELYNAAVEAYSIPPENQGVPTMIVGDNILVGSRQIPQELPGIIEEGLAAGGIPWPEIPGLKEIVEAPPEETTPEEASPTETNPAKATETEEKDPQETEQVININTDTTWQDTFKQDLSGNIISVIVLIGMVITVGAIFVNFNTIPNNHPAQNLSWLTPLLSLVGLGVAGYLAFVEITQSEAICGPVGHCNTVQQSPYAMLFGVLPVGLLGFLGYIGIIILWLAQNYGPSRWERFSATALWAFLLFGTLFSIYLTFLEPFVIGASCMWCLSSAVIMTALLWLNTPPLKHTWREPSSSQEERQYA